VSDFAQSVKQQADIVKVVEGYIRLRKTGGVNFTGLCPFHNEKSPSFSVHAVRQYFYCFGCHESGDVFKFVEKIEKVGFREAVRIVAQKCGIPLPKREFSSPEEAAEARLRGKLLELHEIATAWFEEQLQGPEGALAREYLAGRGLSPEGIKKFHIGYAPDSFHALEERLSGIADDATLRASGLFSSKEQGDGTLGPIYDRFRKRVMFPIANESGRVIAFTARTLETGEKAGPKYINSPETPLYSKGQVLFNLDKAKNVIRQAGFALLVEGQMDCITVYLNGIQNVIATSGTAMTEQQIQLWKRQLASRESDRVRVVANFDPDAAGQNAAAKTIDLLIEENFEVKIVVLEDGLDPDRFIRERGKDAYVKAVKGAQRLEDFLIERSRKMFPGSSSEQKMKQVNYLLSFMKRMSEKLARDLFAADVAQKLGIDSAVLRDELRQAALRRRDHVEVDVSGVTAAERVLIRALANLEPDGTEQRQAILNVLISHSEWFEHLACAGSLSEMARSDEPVAAVTDPSQKSLIMGVLIDADRIPSDDAKAGIGFQSGKNPSVANVLETIAGLRVEWLKNQFRRVESEIIDAQRRGDFRREIELGQQRLMLNRELRASEDQPPPRH
jgi:DNA primase